MWRNCGATSVGKGGGNLSTKMYFIYIYIYNIYIYIYIYIYIVSLRFDFSIAQCRYVEVERDISGPLKKITWTNLFHGASLLQHHLTMVQAKDATPTSKKNYLSPADMNYHHSINIINSCPHVATETKHYCVTTDEQSIEIYRHAYYENL